MRKFILLAGTTLSLGATPAAACDWERMGGPQRYNPLAKYHLAHASPLDANAEPAAQVDERAEVSPEPVVTADVPAEPIQGGGDTQAPDAAATFR